MYASHQKLKLFFFKPIIAALRDFFRPMFIKMIKYIIVGKEFHKNLIFFKKNNTVIDARAVIKSVFLHTCIEN